MFTFPTIAVASSTDTVHHFIDPTLQHAQPILTKDLNFISGTVFLDADPLGS